MRKNFQRIIAFVVYAVVMSVAVGAWAESFEESLKEYENGDTYTQNLIAFMYSLKEEYSESAQWFRRAAEQGDADAQELLTEHGITW